MQKKKTFYSIYVKSNISINAVHFKANNTFDTDKMWNNNILYNCLGNSNHFPYDIGFLYLVLLLIFSFLVKLIRKNRLNS